MIRIKIKKAATAFAMTANNNQIQKYEILLSFIGGTDCIFYPVAHLP